MCLTAGVDKALVNDLLPGPGLEASFAGALVGVSACFGFATSA